jgi:hypothetical protein
MSGALERAARISPRSVDRGAVRAAPARGRDHLTRSGDRRPTASCRERALDGTHLLRAGTGSDTIGRANLDGSAPAQGFVAPDGGTAPCGLAAFGGRLYWVAFGGGGGTAIGRVDLDGQNPVPGLVSGATAPWGVAVDAVAPPPGTTPTTPTTALRPVHPDPADTGTVVVTVPGPGTIVLTGEGLKTSRATGRAGGRVTLRIAAVGAASATLLRRGKASIRAKIAFTPAGGAARSVLIGLRRA